jgi:hypothetical protein
MITICLFSDTFLLGFRIWSKNALIFVTPQILICRADYSTTIVILQGYAFGNKKDLFFRSLTSLKIGLM